MSLFARIGIDRHRMDPPDEAGRQGHPHQLPLTAIELQENTTMATNESAPVPENPQVTDLLHQLRCAATPEAQRDVMVKTILAGRNNEISVAEGKVVSQEFARINTEARVRQKEERARLKAAQRIAD
jgi:hypothetical protein